MKKNLLFGMSAAIGMLLATSCSNEEQFAPSGGEAQVTFSLGLESGMNTRAISDGTGINQLFYAIFDKDGNLVKPATNQEVNKFPLDANISLIKGEEYTAVFWAWDKDCDAYEIGADKKTVTINYDKALNNDENRDAFFKNVTFTVDGNENISVVLKRAFAQLNVGIPASEFDEAKEAGLEIKNSKVEIKKAATTLNLMDGTVDGAQDITFEANTIPTERLYVDADCNGEDEEYVYLSMSYFLANDTKDGASKALLEDLKFTFSDGKGNSFELTNGLANAPVQRNYRTNIVSLDGIGGLITGDVTVKVLLDPLYDGEHTLTNEKVWETNAGIYTEEALAGKTINMPNGWHIRNGYILEPMPEYYTTDNPNGIDGTSVIYEKPYTIDGQNNTVTFEPYEYHFVAKNAFAATNGELVTVKNLTFAGEHFGVFGGVYNSVKNFNTIFENITIENNGIYYYNKNGDIPMSVFSNLGTATLNNCTINGTYWVGKKDLNVNAQNAYDNYGLYDVFVANQTTTKIDNSTISRIYVNAQGILEVYNGSKVDEIICDPIDGLAKAKITIDAEVDKLELLQYSPTSYPYTLTIKANAKIGTLNLNSKENHTFNKNNIIFEEGANITTIICNGVEYTSIADFKAAL